MAFLNVLRVCLQIFTILVTLLAIAFVSTAVLQSGWQIMTEPSTGVVHQHGLWLDYNYVRLSMATTGGAEWEWVMNYKYGTAVAGDPSHHAKPYQETTTILLSVTVLLALIGTFVSYCAVHKLALAIGWAACLLLSALLSAAALAQFFVASMAPENRFVQTHQQVEQHIGYSFYVAVVGVVAYALAMVGSVATTVLIFYNRKNEDNIDRSAFVYNSATITRV